MPQVGPLVRMRIRRELRDKLEGKRVSRVKVNDALALVSDEVIDDAAARVGAPKNVKGPFADWLAQNSDWIKRIVELIVSFLT